MNENKPQNWLKQYRHPIQMITLGVAILAPFGLFYSLQAGQPTPALICFALFALALGVTAVAS